MSALANKETVFLGTGRRKQSVARVRLASGTGKITVNNRAVEEYFFTQQLAATAQLPIATVELGSQVDADISVEGGGPMGQADAVAHGLARALEKMNPDMRIPLKRAGLMTRDPRKRERKKPGQPGARKRFQFSKR